MKPAFSVIFLTTLIGAGQGLFVAIVYGQIYGAAKSVEFGLTAGMVSLGLMVTGLLASFFHLGRPERAWRAVTKWRTSWLSREVIVLPVAMFVTCVYIVTQWKSGWFNADSILWIGWGGIIVMFTLYVCTAMIYACVKFLQEWATPWTVINFILLGIASGFVLASALSAASVFDYVEIFRVPAILLTLVAMTTRLFSFYRNSRIKHRSTVQTAIGVKHPYITQRSMGHTGGSFNTRAFFHHCSNRLIRNLRWVVVVVVFVVPVCLMLLYGSMPLNQILWMAFAVQILGLIAERWLFFAQANHPQNLYYQTVS